MVYNENFAVVNYQIQEQRRQRFLFRSTDKMFYIDTLDGGMLLSNEFVAHRNINKIDEYFLLKRSGVIYVSMTLKLKDNSLFILYKESGNIYDNFARIESKVWNSEIYDLQAFIENANKTIQENFKHFTINLTI